MCIFNDRFLLCLFVKSLTKQYVTLTLGFLFGTRPSAFSATAFETGSSVISTDAIITELGEGTPPVPIL